MTAQAPYESQHPRPADWCEAIHQVLGDKVAGADLAEIERAANARAALPERAPVSAGGDAVAWQFRRKATIGGWSEWRPCDEGFATCAPNDDKIETRALYATPAPPVGADWATMTFDGKRVMCEPEIRKRVESALLFAALEDLAEREAAERPASMYGLVNAAPTPAEARGVGDGVRDGEVLVTVSAFTGSGKSAVCGEIEILCRALGLEVEWEGSQTERNLTHGDWIEALEMYRPRVRIREANVPRPNAEAVADDDTESNDYRREHDRYAER